MERKNMKTVFYLIFLKMGINVNNISFYHLLLAFSYFVLIFINIKKRRA